MWTHKSKYKPTCTHNSLVPYTSVDLSTCQPPKHQVDGSITNQDILCTCRPICWPFNLNIGLSVPIMHLFLILPSTCQHVIARTQDDRSIRNQDIMGTGRAICRSVHLNIGHLYP